MARHPLSVTPVCYNYSHVTPLSNRRGQRSSSKEKLYPRCHITRRCAMSIIAPPRSPLHNSGVLRFFEVPHATPHAHKPRSEYVE